MNHKVFLTYFLLFPVWQALSQEIPLGTWRTHISYTNVNQVIGGNNRIFASVDAALFYYDLDDNSVNRITEIDGLQGGGITSLAYDVQREILIVGYATGNADLVGADRITNLDLISDSQVIGSKKINDILVSGAFAYLATDYGILQVSIEGEEVQGTYREIGNNGEQLGINNVDIWQDSLFVRHSGGIRVAGLTNEVNLADWRFWTDRPLPDGLLPQSMAVSGDKLFVAVDNEGIFEYRNGLWENTPLPVNETYTTLSGSNQYLTVISSNEAVAFDPVNYQLLLTAQSSLISNPNDAWIQDANWWIGDANNGLISDNSGNFTSYSPTGPASSNAFSLNETLDSIFVLTGGYTMSVQPLNRNTGVHIFDSGEWTNRYGAADPVGFIDFTGVAVMPGTGEVFYSSAGDGLLRVSGGLQVIDENTPGSPLVSPDGSSRGLIIPDMEAGTDGIWMINFNAAEAVHRLAPDGVWTSFSVPINVARYAVEIKLLSDLVWLRIAPSRGGGLVVFKPSTGEARFLNQQPDNGSLPSNRINAMDLDKDGFLWLGTDAGVAVITNPFVIEGNINAVEPVFEGRPLLIDESVKAIRVDGGNRKWMGTENGVWLFDPPADELKARFTAANSPLPSDAITDIAIDSRTGEVFFGTDLGIVSFRSDATEADAVHRDVRIFPNPVRSDFQGTVGISGLARDAEIRITDVSGRLVYRTRANGGTASWEINGRDLQSGMYMVFSASPDGDETFVGKIAIIR